MEGVSTKKSPYHGLWIFIPMMVLPSVVITLILYFAIARWQPQYGTELNWASAKTFGCGCGILFHFGCWIAGAFKADIKAVKTRLKEFCANIVASPKLAFSCYWDDVKTLGLAYWIDVAIIGLNIYVFADALLTFLRMRGII